MLSIRLHCRHQFSNKIVNFEFSFCKSLSSQNAGLWVGNTDPFADRGLKNAQIEQRTRGKFQESGMPECPNRTVHTSFQGCSNQTDYQVCLVSRATIHQFRINLHDSCQKACRWLLQICRPKRYWNAAQKNAVEAKCQKDRRDSRGFDAKRRHLHTRNAANQLRES